MSELSEDAQAGAWTVRPPHALTATYLLGFVVAGAFALGDDGSDRLVFAVILALVAWCLLDLRWYRIDGGRVRSITPWPRARLDVDASEVVRIEAAGAGWMSRLYPEQQHDVFRFAGGQRLVVARTYVNSRRLRELLEARLGTAPAADGRR